MRRTKEEADVTRQSLLKAALVVFSRQGYADTRLEDIAEEAGVTRGAIYHHFGSKIELFQTLMADANERASRAMQEAVETPGTPLGLLRRMFVQTLALVEEDENFRAVQEMSIFKTAVIPEMAEGMRLKAEGIRGLTGYIHRLLADAVESGEVRGDIDLRDAAVALMALQNGLLTMWLIVPDLFSLRARGAAMFDLFAGGIAAR